MVNILNLILVLVSQILRKFWSNKEKLLGKIIEIRADSISKSQDGKNWSLRFPRFKNI